MEPDEPNDRPTAVRLVRVDVSGLEVAQHARMTERHIAGFSGSAARGRAAACDISCRPVPLESVTPSAPDLQTLLAVLDGLAAADPDAHLLAVRLSTGSLQAEERSDQSIRHGRVHD
ncbi:hypothetical protein NWFMUON74_43610 [Nocardia wallacei]|uniref:Uncharacterized protein n=1 Tax=Nocardia wallacei TaxID=480035 RepID=A0A7G1KRQ3_9NOCA|nr:hypothetical protein NWFMUON74_43610 [Nocardia wallacei]